jgi:RHS repeat-associated protein
VYAVRAYSIAGSAVAERTNGPTGGNVLRWLAGDAHNTATLEVVVSTGASTVRYEDPYGNPRGTNPGWSSGHTFLNDDQAGTSGTVTIGARIYDPVIGKFLTVDAILTPFNPVANNGYTYSASSPENFSDPSGNCMLNPDTKRCFLTPQSADTAAAAAAGNPISRLVGKGGYRLQQKPVRNYPLRCERAPTPRRL